MTDISAQPSRFAVALLGVGLVSAAALGYEVLLLRLLAIVQWHHYTHMIISLALLGFGASGTFLCLFGASLVARYRAAFAIQALAFAVTALACFWAAQRVPFNPLELGWSAAQLGWLAALYLTLMIPFFFAANCIGLAFMRYRERIPMLYFADLLGAGTGAAAVTLLLFGLEPGAIVPAIAATGLLAGAVCLGERWPRRARVLLLLLGAGLLACSLRLEPLPIAMSEFKAASQAKRVLGAQVREERTTPHGLVTVLANDAVPARIAPGLSLLAPVGLPRQDAVFVDGDARGALTDWGGDLEALAYTDYVPSALPYHLLESPAVLVPWAGTGGEVLQALYHGARKIDAAESNPALVALLEEQLAPLPPSDERVAVHVADGREFLARERGSYDLIQVPTQGSHTASASGLQALGTSSAYTVEALESALAHLSEGGILALDYWVDVPPRGGLKLLATVLDALRARGVERPAESLIWIRGWSTQALLVKNGRFAESETSVARDFARKRGFDLVLMPRLRASEVNRFNKLKQPVHELARELLGAERERFVRRYAYDIRPATDDRPYFFDFFRWETFARETRARAGFSAEIGYAIAGLSLAQAVLAAAAFILLPLAWQRSRLRASPTTKRRSTPVLGYFLLIGLAYLLVEIALLHELSLFLGNPLFAASLVLSGFLVCSGFGSYLAHLRPPGAVVLPTIAILVVGAAYLAVLSPVLGTAVSAPIGSRFALAFCLVAPLAVPMGMLFPGALNHLARAHPPWVPWAWAINGSASVAGAILGVLIAAQLGLDTVLALALALYAATLLVNPKRAVSIEVK